MACSPNKNIVGAHSYIWYRLHEEQNHMRVCGLNVIIELQTWHLCTSPPVPDPEDVGATFTFVGDMLTAVFFSSSLAL